MLVHIDSRPSVSWVPRWRIITSPNALIDLLASGVRTVTKEDLFIVANVGLRLASPGRGERLYLKTRAARGSGATHFYPPVCVVRRPIVEWNHSTTTIFSHILAAMAR